MNSVNELKITHHKDYHSAVEMYVESLLYKFALMQTPFEPITKVVKNYQYHMLRRAAVNVLFKNYGKQAKKRSFWVLRNPSKTNKELATMIIAEEMRLKKMVWHKNDWGEPYKPSKPIPRFNAANCYVPPPIYKNELVDLYCRMEADLATLKKIIDSQ